MDCARDNSSVFIDVQPKTALNLSATRRAAVHTNCTNLPEERMQDPYARTKPQIEPPKLPESIMVGRITIKGGDLVDLDEWIVGYVSQKAGQAVTQEVTGGVLVCKSFADPETVVRAIIEGLDILRNMAPSAVITFSQEWTHLISDNAAK